MAVEELLQVLTQVTFIAAAAAVLVRAWSTRRRVDLDAALLFGGFAVLVAEQWLFAALGRKPPDWAQALSGAIAISLPYLQLRLLTDFTTVPAMVRSVSAAGLVIAVASLAAIPPSVRPAWLTLAYVAYFVLLEVYVTAAFVRAAGDARGVTRRRMNLVAWGSVMLALVILAAGLRAVFPSQATLWLITGRMAGLACGALYFLGFATPAFVRRWWQDPDVHAFLQRAPAYSHAGSAEALIQEIQRVASEVTGSGTAFIGGWSAEEGVLRFHGADGRPTGFTVRPGQYIAGRAFESQQPIYAADAEREDPENAALYRDAGATTILAAPITTAAARYGVLVLYAAKASAFVEDDLALVKLIADQAAVLIEHRALVEETSRRRAQEEMTRMKEEFLSAAAHDLKTPLTALFAQAQLMKRRVTRAPQEPADPAAVDRILSSAQRMTRLVEDLLDATSAERGRLRVHPEPTDLAAMVRQVCDEQAWERHVCNVEAPGELLARVDKQRIHQVLANLLENARKYSPDGGAVHISLRQREDRVVMSVADHGIGIPGSDLEQVFDRFHRAENVSDKKFAGLGLGLYIARSIVELHGGRVWVESQVGQGSTFHVDLPINGPPEAA